MLTITLTPIIHNNLVCIGIFFPRNAELNLAVKKIKNIKWSQRKRCWYVQLTEDNYQNIRAAAGQLATINTAALKEYLVKKQLYQQGKSNLAIPTQQEAPALKPVHNISTTNMQALALLIQRLQLKSYSPSTIRTYRNEFCQLLQTLKFADVDTLTPADLRRYMVFAMEKEGISENTAHSRLNALKFYFEQVLGKEKFFWEIPRPKKPLQLPNVMSENELAGLFNALTNKKHKAILFAAYSAGLRVSEVVHLKLCDIDSGRMVIKIQQSKGKKDRYVHLSPVLLDVLRAYVKICRPQLYLFESSDPGHPYSARSAQKVFQRARQIAGIKKELSFHSLRHSFATHLLEKGIDIRFIKDILGHFDIKTTERYTHVSKSKLITITSPLDDLWLKGEIM